MKEKDPSLSLQKWIIPLAGLLLFIIMLFSKPVSGLSVQGWRTAAVGILMALWWISEIIPIATTALLPLIFFPLLQIADIKSTALPYANPIIFLFMGGFIIAIAMQEWNLHKRIALNIIQIIGFKPRNIILGFMISVAFISMWVSNTAATLMMLPIAVSVIEISTKNDIKNKSNPQYKNFAVILMLCIAYSSNIGGIGTIIGSPTNALFIGFINEVYGMQISFTQWLIIGLPVVLLGLPVTYFILTYITFPLKFKRIEGGKDYIREEINKLGRMKKAEVLVVIIFILTASLWIVRPVIEPFIPGLSDAGIAIFGAVLMFIVPLNIKHGKFLLSWNAAEKLPWGMLILFGGGLTLAGAIQRTGLAEWIGGYFINISWMNTMVIILIITLVIITFTQLTSNVATISAFLPIIGSAALGMGENPLFFAIPATIGASCAFMLPVSTPPNAIAYGSGYVTIPQMAKAGILLNLFFSILITFVTYFLLTLILGIEQGVIPEFLTK